MLLAVVVAGPVPAVKDAATVKGLLYPIPMEYSAGPVAASPYALPVGSKVPYYYMNQPELFALPMATRFDQPQPFYPVRATQPEVPHVKLVLAVPAIVPPGTSISVTVNVNSSPTGAAVVSVTNPVVVSSASTPTGTEAIVVDANIAGK